MLAYVMSVSALNLLFLKKSLEFAKNSREEHGWEHYGYFLTKINILTLLTARLDQILVGSLLGVEALAVYAIGIKFSKAIQDLIKQLLTLTTPKIARSNTLDRRKYATAFLATSAVSVVLIMLTPTAIRVMFTSQYNDSIYLAQIYLAFLPFFVINNIYQKHFKYYLRDRDIMLKLYTIAPLIRGVLLVLFTSLYGVIGAALVQGSRTIIHILVSLFLSKLLVKEDTPPAIPSTKD